MADLEMRILGRFGVLLNGASIPLPARARELLGFLAVQPRRSAFRHQVAGSLWPDMLDERASANLSTCLWRLRKALDHWTAPELVVLSRTEVTLGPHVRLDFSEFQALTVEVLSGRADLEMACRTLKLWRGELLAGECEAEWLLEERERVRLMYLRTLLVYAQMLAKHGHVQEALNSYERLVDMDPTNEDACRSLMILHYSQGNTTEAQRLYSSLSKRLRGDLGVSPEVRTKQIYDAIRLGHPLWPGEATAAWSGGQVDRQPPMVGRHGELRVLHELLGDAANGKLVIAAIEGEAGIGKTRLADEFVRAAQGEGWRVLHASCDELPKASPYSPFRKLVNISIRTRQGDYDAGVSRPFLESLLLPAADVRNPKVASEDRSLFLEAIAGWLRREAQKGLTLLVIEDVHFADAASIDLLDFLAREISDCPLMILLTWRADEYPARVARIARRNGIVNRMLQLKRLGEEEVGRICRAFAGIGVCGQRTIRDVFLASEGNPLFVIEMLKSVALSRSPSVGPAIDATPRSEKQTLIRQGDYDLPLEIRKAVGRRLSRLHPHAHRLLEFAAVCGRRLDLDLLAQVTGFARGDLPRLVRTLHRFGFVVNLDGSHQFHHERIREFCYAMIPTAVRIGLHRNALDALDRFWPERLEERAFHSERAGEYGEAATCWEALGDRATAVWAHSDAIKAYTNALDNTSKVGCHQDTVRYGLLKKRAAVWEHDGGIEKGADDIDEMSRIARRLRDELKHCETIALHSRLLLRRGLFREAAADAREAIAIANAFGNTKLAAFSQEILALTYYRSGHYVEAKRMFRDLIPLLEELKEDECLERVWNRVGSLEIAEGSSAGLGSLDKAERYSHGDLNERGVRNLLRGQTYALMGRGEEAEGFLRHAESDYRRASNSSGQALVSGLLAFVFGCSGDFANAVKYGRRGLPFKCGKSEAYWRVISATNLGHGVLLPLGNYSLAKTIVMKSLRLLPQMAGRTRANLLDLAANVCLESADAESAHDYAVYALEEVDGADDPFFGHYVATLGRVNLALGEPGRAADLLQTAVAALEVDTTQMELAQAYSWLGVAYARAGLARDALVASQKALRMLDKSSGFAYRAQDILWNHFDVLRSRQDPRASVILRKAYQAVMSQSARMGVRMRCRYFTVRVNRDVVDSYEKMLGAGSAPEDPRRRATVEERHVNQLTRVNVAIPRAGVTWGRPLQAGDLVDVLLTLDAGHSDEALRQSKGEVGLRRARVLRLCAEANVQGGDMREEDLARVLKVSTRTIRGDVAFLRAQGCHVQTRGATMH